MNLLFAEDNEAVRNTIGDFLNAWKYTYDLAANGKELSVFIDRSEKEPGRCHLYKANLHVTKDIFIPEELEDAVKEEDEIAGRFGEVVEKRAGE